MFEELLKTRETALGRTHVDTLIAVANLGVNYKDAGRVAEAIPLLEEAYMASKREPSIAFVGRSCSTPTPRRPTRPSRRASRGSRHW